VRLKTRKETIMGWYSKKDTEIITTNQDVLQGEVVRPGDEDFDLDQKMAYDTIRMWSGEGYKPTEGAIRELAQGAGLSEDEVKKRLNW
jgi:hypothetical protein